MQLAPCADSSADNNRIVAWIFFEMRGYHYLAAAALLIGATSHAHDRSLVLDCEPPVRPASKAAAVWNNYVDELDGFRQCVSNFIDRHHQAADLHRTAANSATDRWNDYVRGSLNVPEDFPYVPPTAEPFSR